MYIHRMLDYNKHSDLQNEITRKLQIQVITTTCPLRIKINNIYAYTHINTLVLVKTEIKSEIKLHNNGKKLLK